MTNEHVTNNPLEVLLKQKMEDALKKKMTEAGQVGAYADDSGAGGLTLATTQQATNTAGVAPGQQ